MRKERKIFTNFRRALARLREAGGTMIHYPAGPCSAPRPHLKGGWVCPCCDGSGIEPESWGVYPVEEAAEMVADLRAATRDALIAGGLDRDEVKKEIEMWCAAQEAQAAEG